jgi:hypothetical protein
VAPKVIDSEAFEAFEHAQTEEAGGKLRSGMRVKHQSSAFKLVIRHSL